MTAKKTDTKVSFEESDAIKVIKSSTLFAHTIISLIVIIGSIAMAFAYLQSDTKELEKDNIKQDIVIAKIINDVDDLEHNLHEIDTKHTTQLAVAFEKIGSLNANLVEIKKLLQKIYDDNQK